MSRGILNMFHKYDFSYLILFSIIVCLSVTLFSKMNTGEFLFMHDEYIATISGDLSSQLSSLNPTDLGTPYLLQVVVTFYDRTWYVVSSKAGIDIQTTTKILYTIKLILICTLPYVGFKKLFSHFSGENRNYYLPLVISLWYSFNTYTIGNWNTSGFFLTALITYSLAPLCFYLFLESLKSKSGVITKWKTVIILFLMSFSIYLYAVFIIILTVMVVCVFIVGNQNKTYKLTNLYITLALYAPLSILYFSVLMGTTALGDSIDATKLGATYGNIGGILHVMKGLYNWAAYTSWTPKSIFTFSGYYQSVSVATSSLLLLFILIFGVLKNNKTRLTSILAALLVSLLLAKGTKPPLGNIFLFLYNHVPGFILFRTPDTKFGFGIVLATALSLLYVGKPHRKLVIFTLVTITSLQAVPILTGEALIGRDTETSFDRKIQIRPEHQEYLDYVNNNSMPYGYILTIPALNFGRYNLENNDYYIGYDLLPYFSKLPYISLSDYSVANTKTKKLLIDSYNNQEIISPVFPIRFFVIRKDLDNKEDATEITKMLDKTTERVFMNSLYTIYENPNYVGLVHAEQFDIKRVSSVEYSLKLRNISQDRVITLLQNYNPGWNIYVEKYPRHYDDEKNFVITAMNKVRYLFTKPYSSVTHTLGYNYANSWLLNVDGIREQYSDSYYNVNLNGTMDVDITLYYKPDAIYVSSLLIIVVYISTGTLAIVLRNKRV